MPKKKGDVTRRDAEKGHISRCYLITVPEEKCGNDIEKHMVFIDQSTHMDEEQIRLIVTMRVFGITKNTAQKQEGAQAFAKSLEIQQLPVTNDFSCDLFNLQVRTTVGQS